MIFQFKFYKKQTKSLKCNLENKNIQKKCQILYIIKYLKKWNKKYIKKVFFKSYNLILY